MNYTKGPWELVPTVSSDRKHMFGIAPNEEYHIGTFVSGSRKQLGQFRSNLRVIQHSPAMYEILKDINDVIFDKKETTTSDEEKIKMQLIDLIDKIENGKN